MGSKFCEIYQNEAENYAKSVKMRSKIVQNLSKCKKMAFFNFFIHYSLLSQFARNCDGEQP